MLALVSVAAFAFQVQVRVSSDTARKQGTSISVGVGPGARRRPPGEPKRIPVTEEHLRTAFKDSAARELLLRARVARLALDSALTSYDAMSYQRISAGLGFGSSGPDRLMFRREDVSHVRWARGVGAWIELKGARTAIPIAPPEAADSADEGMNNDIMSPIPYYPGYDALWIGGGVARTQVDEREIVHPIAEGAEAYYTYETGDSTIIHLPDGRVVSLRELRVRPRQPKWNVAVGSLWFDVSTGQLVRAAFRLATPLDVWVVARQDDPHAMDDVPLLVRPLISPMKGSVNAIALEYGLYNGRFWLPRIQSAEGDAQVSFLRVPFKIEQSYKYSSVNGTDSLPRIVVRGPIPDSITGPRRDSLFGPRTPEQRAALRAAQRAERDSIAKGLKPKPIAQCDTSTIHTITTYRYNTRLPIAYQVPCDQSKLATSPDLPASIYDPGEEIFGASERDALIAQALSMGAQPRFGPLPPTIHWGLDLMRFNRIEGLSVGAGVDEQLGAGYAGSLVARIGTADHEANAELGIARSNLSHTLGVTGYNRLVSASDWGDPLSFGSSLSALLYGRDEGFYYRASGVELTGANARGTRYEWRLFAEDERSAAVENTWSFGARFVPNLTARSGAYAGGGLRVRGSHGEDPQALRVTSDLRFEAAASRDSAYGRAAAEFTVSDALGPLAGAITLSGGSSVGALPAQRLWYLGGAQTVRGQTPDTLQRGNAYWLTRTELGINQLGVRPSVFADIGWTGDRTKLNDVGRPLSGVGSGLSFLDGLFRFDVSRGLFPRKQWRAELYVNARF
jgi:hypothetical protein